MSLDAAVLTSHAPCARIVTATTTYDPDRIVLDGSVTSDRRREVRRSASLTLVSGTRVPLTFGDEFAQGSPIRLERGARIAGLDTFALLGVFEVMAFDASMAGRLSLTAEDPSTALQQEMGETLVIAPGTSAAEVVRLLWGPVLGDTTEWDLDAAGMATGEVVTVAEDEQRLHAAIGRVTDMGLELYLSRVGLPTLRPHVDPATLLPTRSYRQEEGVALATDLSRRGDRRAVNRQIVVGEPPTGTPVRAVVDVTDLASPIHASRIGLRVAPIHRSAAITSQYQAEIVAHRMLVEANQWADTVIWVGVPDPAVEPGEVIGVYETQTRTDSVYRVESVTCPVATGAMSIEASLVVPMFAA